MTLRLAHISDIHLGPLPKVKRSQLFSKRITGYVNFRRNRRNVDQPQITAKLVSFLKRLAPDHTVITGDLINLGLELEFENAARWLAGLGEPADNTVVLGNHDAYVRGARDKAMMAWQEWICGDDGKTIRNADDYPVVRRRGKVSLIGCNSARASAPFLATGYFKKKQARGLEEILDAEHAAGQITVILIHHPPYPRATARHKRLIGLSKFTKVIAKHGADLILHGHTHLATQASLKGPDGKVPVICVPAAYQWPGHRKPPAGINLFTVSGHHGNAQIALERYAYSGTPGEEITLAEKTVLSE
ncbi:metallophosphoesterase family protein [Salaquimonas pukyongi]|uniref:metallophosphoesterase family protein n=1 Tax=Salaquimonas pukyongi TaxID=2712698 RepID=UPI00096B7052|nr:metallophosphoesterase [Salaquimonas pukyongi]